MKKVKAEIEKNIALLWSKDSERKRAGAIALANFATGSPANQKVIRRTGGLLALIGLLRNAEVKEDAARVLKNLALNAVNQKEIREAGGIAPLVGLLEDAEVKMREYAAGTLSILAVNLDNQKEIREAGGVALLIGLLGHTKAAVREYAVLILGILVVANPANRDTIRDEGGIAPLIGLLEDAEVKVREYAVLALSVLAVNPTNRDAIRNEGGIAPLIKLLRDANEEMRKYAAGALSNLAANNLANQNAIREAGGILPLIRLLRDTKVEVSQCAAEALGNLAQNSINKNEMMNPECINALTALLKDVKKEMSHAAMWVLANIACDQPEYADRIRDNGGIKLLQDLLAEGKIGVLLAEERAILTKALEQLQASAAPARDGFAFYEPRLAADDEVKKQREYIAGNIELSEYYSVLQGKIHEIYIAALGINSKMVEGAVLEQGIKWTAALITKLLKGISLVESAASAAVEGAVAQMEALMTSNRIGHFLKYFPMAHTALDQIEAVVRELTLTQESQILARAVKTPRGFRGALHERFKAMKDHLIVNDIDTHAKAFAAQHLHEILVLLLAGTLSAFTFKDICKALNLSIPDAVAIPTAHGVATVSVSGFGGGGSSAAVFTP